MRTGAHARTQRTHYDLTFATQVFGNESCKNIVTYPEWSAAECATMTSTETIYGTGELTNSNAMLTDPVTKRTMKERIKLLLKLLKQVLREITVEPCLFIYMTCIYLSSLATQNMHLEKSCRVNFHFGDEICDRIRDRNTTGLDIEVKQVQTLVAKVVAWKFPLQTAIPAVLVLFVGAWSDKHKRRKICILLPMIGEILSNIGLLLATYYFYELSLIETALIETLPAALSGSYIIIFMGMYSFIADRTTEENRTFRLGLVAIFVNIGTSAGTALSGVLLRMLGFYGMFSTILGLHTLSFIYGLLKLEDVTPVEDDGLKNECGENKMCKILRDVVGLVVNTILVALKPRANYGRLQVALILLLYIIMVGPLYGDSQVAYLYAIRKFNFTEVEYSVYGTINIVLGLIGTMFCISVLSKTLRVQDSILGALAGVSRIAGCVVLAFATTRAWFYSAPAFSILSSTGLTAIRSIATKTVPAGEIAKLNSLMGVMEAIAPSVYMPASSYIYVSSIDAFPGAFYLFDAALTIVAIVLFGVMYILAKRKENIIKLTSKEECSRTNEVSRF